MESIIRDWIDKQFIEQFKHEVSIFRKLSWVYRSNWRVLHIDGLEGSRRTAIKTGPIRQFFTYNQN